MSKLVLISHGDFSAALKASAEMIMGPQDDIATVGLQPNEGPEDFRTKFEAAIAGESKVTVLADLKAGRRAMWPPRCWRKAATLTCTPAPTCRW